MSNSNYGCDKSTAKKYTCSACLFLVALVLFLVMEIVIAFILFFSSGILRGTAGWAGIAIFSYIIGVLLVATCCYLPCLLMRRRRNTSDDAEDAAKPVEHYTEEGSENGQAKTKRVAAVAFFVGLIFVLLFIELCLVFANPVQSIYPLRPISADAFEQSEFRPSGCPLESRVEAAKQFYVNSTVDFTPLRVVYGGLPLHFQLARAQVVDTTVYLTDSYCPSTAIMVHELAHVWQFQQGTWFSPFAYEFLSWMLEQAQCRSCPYDYGDLQGLTDAFAAGKDMSFFGFEQQASIVEDYFVLVDSGSTSDPSFNLLKHFSDQILQDAL